MKHFIKIILTIVILSSCDERNIPGISDLNDVRTGGFAIFDGNPVTTSKLEDQKYTAAITDPNSNISKYRIFRISIRKVGSPVSDLEKYTDVNFEFKCPGTIDLSYAQIANVFNIPITDIKPKVEIRCVAEVTTNDGRKFIGFGSTVLSITNNDKPFQVSTFSELNTSIAFRSAMLFKITIE
jgi:hypothetical protein